MREIQLFKIDGNDFHLFTSHIVSVQSDLKADHHVSRLALSDGRALRVERSASELLELLENRRAESPDASWIPGGSHRSV